MQNNTLILPKITLLLSKTVTEVDIGQNKYHLSESPLFL